MHIRDLSDPAQGPHAMQRLVDDVAKVLPNPRVHRASPIVSVADNYDRLRYPPDAAARDKRYTRYLGDGLMLRSHTSAMIPPLLAGARDVTLLCPGITYRRDTIDRWHTGEPHQMDSWHIGPMDLDDLISRVVGALLPGRSWITTPTSHPYTLHGRQIDVEGTEIGECGVAHPELVPVGLAMGIGLDRVFMLRKGLHDIRLLRSTDPRIAAQMLDLEPYRPVSSQPAAWRDLSIATAEDDRAEDLGDRVRTALGDRAALVEEVRVLSETPHDALPPAARQRLGMRPGQKNVALRVVLRDLSRSLGREEANELRDDVYAAIHRGDVFTWAARTRQ